MIIKKIKIKKKNVEVICSENVSFEISLDTYTSNYILIGDTIDQKKINELVKSNEIEIIKGELINKISRKRLSKKECINYLSSSNLKDEIVDKIIFDLEKSGFINDIDLAESIIVSCLVNKKGVLKMKETLAKRYIMGNYDEYIQNFNDQKRYRDNIVYLIDKYIKLGKKNSDSVLKHYVASKLMGNGYLKEEIMPHIVLPKRDECEIAKEEIIKFFKIRDRNEQNIAKITRKLLSKGFNYDIIKSAIERSGHCETN